MLPEHLRNVASHGLEILGGVVSTVFIFYKIFIPQNWGRFLVTNILVTKRVETKKIQKLKSWHDTLIQPMAKKLSTFPETNSKRP